MGKNKKKITIFNFYNLKNPCILHGHVFVMSRSVISREQSLKLSDYVAVYDNSFDLIIKHAF